MTSVAYFCVSYELTLEVGLQYESLQVGQQTRLLAASGAVRLPSWARGSGPHGGAHGRARARAAAARGCARGDPIGGYAPGGRGGALAGWRVVQCVLEKCLLQGVCIIGRGIVEHCTHFRDVLEPQRTWVCATAEGYGHSMTGFPRASHSVERMDAFC